MTVSNYKETDRMSDVISDEFHLLQMLSRFGIPLGFGEKTIREVCDEAGVDCDTFLVVANYIKSGDPGVALHAGRVSVGSLMSYLRQAHDYFLGFELPAIRRKLLEALDCSQRDDVTLLILKFYDAYMNEVRAHMELENRKIFTYVDRLMAGEKTGGYEIAQFARNHENINKKLQELKNIIIRYYVPQGDANLLNAVLFDIFNCEKDLFTHCEVENLLFVPAVELLERKVACRPGGPHAAAPTGGEAGREELSEREREVVACVVKGMTNKETAEQLYISLNTVLTHRKNIARKLQIRSVAGLTIYAIVNKLVNIDEVKAT